MATHLVRALAAAVFLAGVLPTDVLAQTCCADPCDGGIRNLIWHRQPDECSCPCVLEDDPERGPLGRFFLGGEWYFSWGYSREAWGRTNIGISQPALGNHFTVFNVKGFDDPSFNDPTAAQYNIRLGRFYGERRVWGVEVNFDHTKYATRPGQSARVAGTLGGQPVDGNRILDENFFFYKLHNGVNHLNLNVVRRAPLYRDINENFSVAALGKFGFGLMVPHAENTIQGNPVDVGGKTFNNLVGVDRGWWQLNGWTTAFEFGVRIMLWYPIYLELTDKIAYARLENVPVFQGTARHDLWMNEAIVSIGITFGPR